MVWVRLLGVIAALALMVFAFRWWHDRREEVAKVERDRLALVTAQVWVGSAEYRQDPARYLAWRDSLLEAEGLSADSLQVYLRRYQDHPAGYEDYTRLVSYYVDSIIQETGQLPDTVLFDTTGGRQLLIE